MSILLSLNKINRVILIKNFYPLEKDPRLIKIIEMLKNQHFLITFLSWETRSDSIFKVVTKKNNDIDEIILTSKAPPFGLKTVPLLPIWWIFVFHYLIKTNWDILHVINFHSILPAIVAAKIKSKPIVYDIEDTYVDQLSSLPSFLRNIGIMMERSCMKFVDAVILVDEMQILEFKGIPNYHEIIYDSPGYFFEKVNVDELNENKIFTIFFAGRLYKLRHLNLESLVDAIRNIDEIKLLIAGEGDLVEKIKLWVKEMPEKIHFIGQISYPEVIKLSYEADLLISLRDPDPLVQKYICGSKFLESMMVGKPIIVNMCTSAAYKVQENKCGIIVDAKNIEDIKNGILKLKNNKDLCNELGMNGKKAFEQKYSWELMRTRLLNLYYKLLSEKK